MTVREIVKTHIDNHSPVSISKQVEMLGIARSSVYYQPKPPSAETLAVMDSIDRIYTACPFYGVRRITAQLKRDGQAVNHKRVQRLMRVMGLQAIYPRPSLSENSRPHPVYPYLLRELPITRPNQVWGTDITYIRLKTGFIYLTAYLDWFSRYVLSWRLSISLQNSFCLEAASEATQNFGEPEITNSDQGTQYTSADYLDFWQALSVQISMDGQGRALDNIFTERLWRTVKYEEVYLKSYETVADATDSLKLYFDFYNKRRLHQSLGYKTPEEIYFGRR